MPDKELQLLSRQLRAWMMSLTEELSQINRELLFSFNKLSQQDIIAFVDSYNDKVDQLRELFALKQEYGAKGLLHNAELVDYLITRRMQRVAAFSERIYTHLEKRRKQMRLSVPLLRFDGFGKISSV